MTSLFSHKTSLVSAIYIVDGPYMPVSHTWSIS